MAGMARCYLLSMDSNPLCDSYEKNVQTELDEDTGQDIYFRFYFNGMRILWIDA